MRTTTLMTIQFISLALIISCAEKLLTEIFPTIIFLSAFIVFASCSLYISKHEKELIRENNRRKDKKEKSYSLWT